MVAEHLGLSTATVRTWVRYASRSRQAARRGRPSRPLTDEEHRLMQLALLVHGGQAGVPTLQRWCPQASRRRLAAALRTCRLAMRRGLLHVIWTRAGRVWAMDFSEVPTRIDGEYRYVLHIRDLGSHYHLAALPVRQATAQTACDLLVALCARIDAPLVLKVDNGSAFGSHGLDQWAHAMGVLLLYSPVACPTYNGSIEASIGAITTRAHHSAAAAGHPAYWTASDVEAARVAANLVGRQSRGPGPNAATLWRARDSITAAERRRFFQRYRRALIIVATTMRGHGPHILRAQRRRAIVRTLDVLGYISITRRGELVHTFLKQKRQTFHG